jgi:hypothetical protein
MSRIDLGASSASGDSLPFEAFVVLRETVVIAQRSKDSITFSQPNTFDRVSQERMQFGPRERAQLILGHNGKYVVRRPQEQVGSGGRGGSNPSPQVASFTTIALPYALGNYGSPKSVVVTDDASLRTLLQSAAVNDQVGLVSTRGFPYVVSEAEFEAFFARPVAFLASKTFWQFLPDVFVEHGDSLYVVDRKGLIHITPENNMKNAAEFVALSETSATNTLIYFK